MENKILEILENNFDESIEFDRNKATEELLVLFSVSKQGELLFCPNCKSNHTRSSTHKGFLQGYCFECSNHWAE